MGGKAPLLSPPVTETVAQKTAVRTWALRAYRAEQAGDLQEAERCFRWLIRLRPEDPWSYVEMAWFMDRHHRDGHGFYMRAEALGLDDFGQPGGGP